MFHNHKNIAHLLFLGLSNTACKEEMVL